MGLEARCTVRIGRKQAEGKALLESAEIRFRGDLRLDIPFTKIREVAAREGCLEVTHEDGRVVFELGDQAERWAAKIRSPKSRLAKLGIKAGHRVAIVGVDDPDLESEITAAGAEIVAGRAKELDLVFLGATRKVELARLVAARERLEPAGAIWVVWRKGRPELREDDVRKAAIAAGLVDVKVMAFSATLSALKLVIPLDRR